VESFTHENDLVRQRPVLEKTLFRNLLSTIKASSFALYVKYVSITERNSLGQPALELIALTTLSCLKNRPLVQGCQMVCFQTKNPILGKFWSVLQKKMMVYFMDTWSILRSFVLFYGHLV
jgi:hypothetical protein